MIGSVTLVCTLALLYSLLPFIVGYFYLQDHITIVPSLEKKKEHGKKSVVA